MVRGAQAFQYARRFKIYLATQPVDIRTGIDGLVNSVSGNFDLAPFSGGFVVFRFK
ncbi:MULTISPECIES: IS66 family insertion sequence element accessory protein TnpB [unclassified Thioclava]|uniref:IS66 family insertion sequence element accessory protein TnpB n=1 Tax=Thioclava sp. F28-4 TaxID=1915315 RepID=UPI0009970BF0